jgi:hypothetical protein
VVWIGESLRFSLELRGVFVDGATTILDTAIDANLKVDFFLVSFSGECNPSVDVQKSLIDDNLLSNNQPLLTGCDLGRKFVPFLFNKLETPRKDFSRSDRCAELEPFATRNLSRDDCFDRLRDFIGCGKIDKVDFHCVTNVRVDTTSCCNS